MSTICKAKKNKIDNLQCPNKAKPNEQFCGKHIRTGITNLYIEQSQETCILNKNKLLPITDIRLNVLKKLENQDLYNEYLDLRKKYTIYENNKVISLLEYIENNKLETYPMSRIYITLDYYNIKPSRRDNNGKFIFASKNVNRLIKIFELILNATTHLESIIKIQRFVKKVYRI